MPDTREAILTRLGEIVAGVDGFVTTGRNVSDLEDADLPALVVIDGDETALDMDEVKRRSPGLQPRFMVLSPVISAALLGLPEALGPQASDLRARIINAIMTDTTIQGLCINKRMSYEGCKTMPSSGARGAIYGMSLQFTFTYPFRPQDLGPGSS